MEIKKICVDTLLVLFNVEFETKPTLTDIAKQTNRTLPHIGKMMRELNKKGIFMVRTDKRNKRRKQVTLTTKGKIVKEAVEVLRRNL